MTHKALIRKLQISCLGLDRIDPLCLLVDDVIEALRENAMREVQRLGQEIEQEPVAWMFQHDETGRMNYVSNDGIHNPTMFLEMNPRYAFVCALYTAPPQRKPMRLTDEEILHRIDTHVGVPSQKYPLDISDLISFARAIEAKLKQLNT